MNSPRLSVDPVTEKRFELVRQLGEGAAGAVFLALDRETGEQVALKKLFKLDQRSVARFKREFRALADIHHPNLVKLYDLQRGQQAWFLTMEYVAGKDLRQWLDTEATHTREIVQPANDNADPSTRKLLRLFYDLACGVHAIHRAGMLHRDLKPTNVVISDTGRVVVLDFGLVREIDSSVQLTQDGMIAGTPAYMPPEQAMAETLSEASDWYAFGAMLYEAISGVLPIDGRNVALLLQHKLRDDPEPLETGAPPEVLDLCMRLLARAPQNRPSGTEILQTLAAASGTSHEPTTLVEHPLTVEPVAPTATTLLFGRDAELEQLQAASDTLHGHSSVVVHVRGTSGSGKSTLVEHFLDEVAAMPLAPAVVLRSRCYEREAMPFKALDGVMDALVSYLSQLDDVACAHLLPSEIADLTRLFPVFERLRSVQQLLGGRKPRGDETQIRRRAERALRTLVTSIAVERSLFLWVDDLQWGDLDSASVLHDWLEHPLQAPVYIVLSYRSEELQTSSSLRLLLDRAEHAESRQITIDLEPLQAADVRSLCMHRLAQHSQAPEAMVERIVQESRGNPFLAQQLTAIAEAKLARHDTSLEGLSMDALIERADSHLGESARALLNVLAIAGRPLRSHLALNSAGVFSAGRAHIHALRVLRLIRTRDVADERLLEVYHDRVRETVRAALSPEESMRLHAALLRELEASALADHDWLHSLALGAGQRVAAFRYGLLAAERASETLAFERAADLYNQCLTLFNGELELYALWVKLATAQAHCRRGYEAAKAYAKAAEHAPADKQAELLQLAAAHLVRSGRFEEGERLVQTVLKMHKMYVPKTQAGLFAAIAWEHARIALRSFDVPTRETTPVHLQNRALLYGTLSIETQLYNPVRSALFQARALRMALDYGTPENVARSLCLAATIACLSGTQRAARRSQEMLRRADELFTRRGSPEVQLELLCARAVCAQFVGDVERALEPSHLVEQLLQSRSATSAHGDYYYMFAVQMVQVTSLQSMGRLVEARKVLQEHVARARDTNNLAAILQVTVNRTVDEQAFELCAGSRARLDQEYEKLPRGNINVLAVAHMMAVMRAACMTRDYSWAFARLDEFWQPYTRSIMHQSAFLASVAHTTHARILLNHYVESGGTGDADAVVRSDLAALRRLPGGLLSELPIARTQARLAALKGDRARAITLLRPILERMQQTTIKQETEHDRYTLGLLIGGAEGAELVAHARAGLSECGICDPDVYMRAYVPELMR